MPRVRRREYVIITGQELVIKEIAVFEGEVTL